MSTFPRCWAIITGNVQLGHVHPCLEDQLIRAKCVGGKLNLVSGFILSVHELCKIALYFVTQLDASVLLLDVTAEVQ